MMKNLFKLLFLFLLMYACKEEENFLPPQKYHINGKVEKGPFVGGSKITIQPLDEALNPIGSSYSSLISNDEGSFDFGSITLESSYALLTADGYYFNETTGNLSDGQITLTSLVDLQDYSSINLNILTHLKRTRITHLVINEKKSFKEANQQSQLELLSAFGLQRLNNRDASLYSIASGTDEAAGLIIISATLLHNKSDAKITQYLSILSDEFKTGFSNSTLTDLQEESRRLSLNDITTDIKEYFKKLGKEVSIKDLRYYIDWDGDGIAGNEFGEGEIILSLDQDTIFIPPTGGEFELNINTNLNLVLLSNPTFDDSSISIPIGGIQLFKSDSIKYSSSITNDKKLKLIIAPSESKLMYNDEITLYSPDGELTTTLVIVQEGNEKKKFMVTPEGERVFEEVYKMMRNYYNLLYTAETYYTQTSPLPTFYQWEEFYNHTLTSESIGVTELYAAGYQVLRYLRTIREFSPQNSIIQTTLSFHTALMYYHTAVLWENVPFIPLESSNYFNEPKDIVQLHSNEIFTMYESQLLNSIELLNDGKIEQNALDLFFISKDVVRITLAKMYMYSGKYDQALPILKNLTENGHYTLNNSRIEALGRNTTELIYGFSQENYESYFKNEIETNFYIPVFHYTEILLSLAECEFKTGNRLNAEMYLNMVSQIRGITLEETDFINKLTLIWKEELKGTGSYFTFLKRNNIATTVLDIPEFRLIFPIPFREFYYNNFVQNPGYYE